MKIAGIIIVFFSCCTAGYLRSLECVKTRDQIYAFIKLIEHIKHEIAYYLTRQEDIFLKFENKYLEKIGFLKILREEKIKDEKSLLYHALQKSEKYLSLSLEGKKILYEFAKTLGHLSPSEQCTNCDKAILQLEELYKKEKEEACARVKLNRCIGCLGGAFAVLILL